MLITESIQTFIFGQSFDLSLLTDNLATHINLTQIEWSWKNFKNRSEVTLLGGTSVIHDNLPTPLVKAFPELEEYLTNMLMDK